MRSQFRQVNQLFVSFSTKQLIVIALIVCVYWAYTWWNLANLENRSSAQLKEEILVLSEQYVRALAREHKDLVDGPYSGRLTAYDLKRTMAVLLQNILERLSKLENRLSNATVVLVNESTFVPVSVEGENLKSSKIYKDPSASRAMMSRGVRSVSAGVETIREAPNMGKGEELEASSKVQTSWCGLDINSGKMPNTMLSLWPECTEKLQWMRKYWRSNACYTKYGVDGSECSFYIYLSEIEAFCPKLPLRRKTLRTNSTITYLWLDNDSNSLLKKFSTGVQGPYAKDFVEHLANVWKLVVPAARSLSTARLLSKARPKLRIVLYATILTVKRPFFPGLLNEEARRYAVRQWAELAATLFLYGHDVTLCSSEEELKAILRRFPDASSPCQARRTLYVDLIYTDYPGVTVFRTHLGQNLYQRFSCLLRVLDPFSTQPSFAYLTSSTTCPVCGSELNPKQFLSANPPLIAPDNTFLGHIVNFTPSLSSSSSSSPVAVLHLSSDSPQPPAGLVASLRRHFKLVAATMDTAITSQLILDEEWQRGLTWTEYRKLLGGSELFVGIGWPLESPLAIEALAEGCVVLGVAKTQGAKLSELKSGWPSNRSLGTQFEYLRRRIGQPSVLDIEEEHESSTMGMEKLIRRLRRDGREHKGVEVKEFGAEAYLIRMDKHLRKQDFCEGGIDKWPPATAISYYLGVLGDSCEETCRKRDLICEPSHFVGINSRIELLERGIRCERIAFDSSPILPYFIPEKETCAFQSEPKLFSCAEGSAGRMRICPCRDYLPDQSALCSQCF